MYRQKGNWFPHEWVAEIWKIAGLACEIEQEVRKLDMDLSDDIVSNLVCGELVVRAFDRMHELAKAHYQGGVDGE